MNGAPALGLLALGGCIALTNFYLSFLRMPFHQWRGRRDVKWVSGIPLIGSFVLVIGLFGLDGWLALLGAFFFFLDTGGIFWLVLVMVRELFRHE
jgi:hypothetical protein